MTAEFIEDTDSQEIEISNAADWAKFHSPTIQKTNDPFKIEGEDLTKVSGLSPAFRRKMNRDLQKKFSGIDGTGTQQNLLQQAITGYAMFDLVEPPYNMEYLSQIYEISAYNYSAINAKVANIVGLGFEFIETRKTIEAMDGIDNEVGRTSAGKIGYVGHIPAKTMRVRRLRDGFIQLLYGKAVFFRNFGDQETPNPISGGLDRPNEIIHMKKYTPQNNYYGIPDIVSAANAMSGNELSAKYNLDYFENKAVPRYIITVKGAKLSTESERKLLEFFQVGLKGKNHRSLYIPLPADSPDAKVEFKMEPVEANPQESSFNTYRKMNRDEILMAHRTPINKIGTPEGINLAAARDADKTFKEQVCRPAQDILEKKLNRLISEMTDALEIKFNELALTDEDTLSKIDERYLRMQVITPNEVRIRKGMVPLDGGDEVVQLKPQQQAEIRAQAGNTRARSQERQNTQPDISGEGRNEQGAGRQVE